MRGEADIGAVHYEEGDVEIIGESGGRLFIRKTGHTYKLTGHKFIGGNLLEHLYMTFMTQDNPLEKIDSYISLLAQTIIEDHPALKQIAKDALVKHRHEIL